MADFNTILTFLSTLENYSWWYDTRRLNMKNYINLLKF